MTLTACATSRSVSDAKNSLQSQVNAPNLILPENDRAFDNANITLMWNAPRSLEDNELYNVRLWAAGESTQDIAWTTEPVFPAESYISSVSPNRFYWQIAIIATDEQGNYSHRTSEWSEAWSFERLPPTPLPSYTPLPTMTPTPTPVVTATSLAFFEEVNPLGQSTPDVPSLINIQSVDDIAITRSAIIQNLWVDTLPVKIPTNVIHDIANHQVDPELRYLDLDNLSHIDRITIKMDYGFESIAYHFVPEYATDRLMIYHQGHAGDFINGKETINFFLQNNFHVIALAMPALGMNTFPDSLVIPNIGNVPTHGIYHTGHERFGAIQPIIEGNALRFFVEPVIQIINYSEQFDLSDDVSMLGISGGGWTTVMAAAVDVRIKQSYSVAGTNPFILRYYAPLINGGSEVGDWENWLPGLVPDINYFDLYLLGATGSGRYQMHVYNQYDSCCFAGIRHSLWSESFLLYHQNFDGAFEVYVDSLNYEHSISDMTLEYILETLR